MSVARSVTCSIAKSPLNDFHSCRPHQDMARLLRGWVLALAFLLSFATLRLQVQLSARNTAIEASNGYSDLPAITTDARRPRGMRSKITSKEFHHNEPPPSIVDKYFNFVQPDWEADSDSLRLKRSWKCSDDPETRNTKLIFLHLTRSAGSTVRPFFRAYSSLCNRSIAIVSQCVDVGIESMEGKDPWRNGENSPQAAKDCWLSLATNRTGSNIESNPGGLKGRFNTEFLKSNSIDILAGHLSLGTDSFWVDRPRESPIYSAFFRHPLAKYVSQVLFVEQTADLSVQEVADLVYQTASQELARGRFRDTFSSYLITPQQKAWVDMENVEWTMDRRVNLTLSNLVHDRVVVGLVERIPESFQMLGFILDEDQEISQLLDFFSSPPKSTKLHEKIGGKQRTQEIIRVIEQDEKVLATLNNYLQHELKIYDFAKDLHIHQYQWMKQDFPDRESTKEQDE